MQLNNWVKMHRARLDMTQQQLAEASGVSRQTIHAIERGKAEPSVALALRMSQVLGVPISELFWLEGQSEPELPRHK
jgi:putative transcriptional regulator